MSFAVSAGKTQADKLSFKDDMAPKVFGKIAPTPKAPVA